MSLADASRRSRGCVSLVQAIFCTADRTADQADQLFRELTVHSLYMEVLQQEREFNDMRRMLYPNPLFTRIDLMPSLLTRVCF